jgi:hypothetical protein
MGGATNSTFLALIPKERNDATFSRFRPISLCNVSYKIISKIIATRMQRILPKLISPSQGGLWQKDKFGITLFWYKRRFISMIRGDRGMEIKIDMVNAFDQVRHSFLLEVLDKIWVPSLLHSLD